MTDARKPTNVSSLAELQDGEHTTSDYFTNLPGEGRKLLSRITEITGPASLDKDEVKDEVLQVRYYYCHLVAIEREATGELALQVRVVLEDVEGRTISFMSNGVVASLDQICTHLGPDDWQAGVPIRVESRRSNKGRNVLRLCVVD
jgi:hypothetical protein